MPPGIPLRKEVDTCGGLVALDTSMLEHPPPTRRLRPAKVYLLEISLRDIPTVWRRVAVPATTRLSRLHDVIQAAMGWQDSHLHEFMDRTGCRYGVPENDDYEMPLDENEYKINALLQTAGDTLRYMYDFGDSWDHEIVLKKIVELPYRPMKAELIEGAGNCPPEDCGGAPGYVEMLKALADSNHPEHRQFVEWLPEGRFDPAAFNAEYAKALVSFVRV